MSAVLLRVVLLAAVVALALAALAPVPSDTAGPAEFDLSRARAHLPALASAPHPTGSAELGRVRAYLVQSLRELGVEVSEDAPLAVSAGGQDFPIHNVVARLRGTAPAGAVLLCAHYDSVPVAPGAGDNGAAVAGLLEAMRALAAGPPPRHDVIALFTDGEERGLLGARVFVQTHPWRDDVALVLNFDARGSRGPSLMFQTAPPAAALVEAWAEHAPQPTGSSVMAAVYERMPNDSDFTVFAEAGLPGLNFAFIAGYETYHTPLDTVDRLAEESLWHHGATMLALARHLAGAGNSPLPPAAAAERIWFNPVGSWLWSYPASLVWPLTAAAALLWIVAVGLGVRAGAGRGRRVAGAALLVLGAAAAALGPGAALAHGVLAVARADGPGPIAHTAADGWLYLGLVLVALATGSLALWLARRALRGEEVALGTALLWIAGLVASSIALPEGSYLFLVPPLACLAVLAVGFLRRRAPRAGVYLAACVPALTLVAPTVWLFFLGMTPLLAWAANPLVVLVAGLVSPGIAGAPPVRQGRSGRQ